MASIDALQERVKGFEKEKEEIVKQGKGLIEQIQDLNKELMTHDAIRVKINKLKLDKDHLVEQYIDQTKQPNLLDQELINYKALFFYFQNKFIESSETVLSLDDYVNDYARIQESRMNKLATIFGKAKQISIKTHTTNFPHLIGYKEEEDTKGSVLSDPQRNRDFLKQIYYETNLLKDYQAHGCKIDKIQAISWIIDTLKKPTFVFQGDALKESKLKADLIFVRKQEGIYHYVSLKDISKQCAIRNQYVINSHHPLMHDAHFHRMFNKNFVIYTKKIVQR